MSARDLPDGCVALSRSYGGPFYEALRRSLATHLALPTTAMHALVDKAGRVEGLEREVAALKGVLGEARGAVNESLEACGPCDHSVNICVCGLRDLLARIDALLGDAR